MNPPAKSCDVYMDVITVDGSEIRRSQGFLIPSKPVVGNGISEASTVCHYVPIHGVGGTSVKLILQQVTDP